MGGGERISRRFLKTSGGSCLHLRRHGTPRLGKLARAKSLRSQRAGTIHLQQPCDSDAYPWLATPSRGISTHSRHRRRSHFGGGSRTFSPPSAPPHVIRRPLGFRSKQQHEHTRLLLLVRCLTRKPLHHLSRRRLPVHFGERGYSRELVRTIAAELRQQVLASAFILALPVAFIPQS